MSDLYEIYTDGGCFPNPGKGAWALVVIKNGLKIEDKTGTEESTTNNRMEYIAVINALKIAKLMNVPLVIRSDSELLVNTYNSWMNKWASLGWVRAGKNKEIKNLDLVKELFSLKREMHDGVIVKWVKGHNGNQWNEYCDELCNDLINPRNNKLLINKSLKLKLKDIDKMIYYCDRMNCILSDISDVDNTIFDSIDLLNQYFITTKNNILETYQNDELSNN